MSNEDEIPSAKRIKTQKSHSTPAPSSQIPLSQQPGGPQYRVGSIVRLSMKNFVTYSEAEIRPGPQLNVALGPNGTGKSTLVCAMVLGLGGKPAILGRAKEPRDYIKHGEEQAVIIVELYGGKGKPNIIIQRKIFNDNSSTWRVNGKSSKQAEVLDFVKKMNVQVENLCQFLPQDRVSSFAAMDSMQLLHETEMAINEDLHEQHLKLIALKKEETESRTTFDNHNKVLADLQDQNDSLRRDVLRFQERQKLEEQLKVLESKKPWLLFEARRVQAVELQQVFQAAESRYNEATVTLEPLKRAVETAVQQLETNQTDENKLVTAVKNTYAKKNQLLETIKDLSTKTSSYETQIAKIDEREARRLQELTKVAKQIEALKTQLEAAQQKEDERISKLEELQREQHQLKPLETAAAQEVNKLQSQIQPLQYRREQIEALKKKLNDKAHQKRSLLEAKSRESAAVYKFIESQRANFKGTVWGPLFFEINVNDPESSSFLEKIISFEAKMGFLFEYQEDMDTANTFCKRNNITPPTFYHTPADRFTDQVSHPIDKKHLPSLGLDGFLSDAYDAEPMVKFTLNSLFKLHTVPFGKTKVVEDKLDAIQNLAKQADIRRFFSPGRQYSLNPSKYSSNVTLTIDSFYNKDSFFTSSNADEIQQAESELAEIVEEVRVVRQKLEEAQRKADEIKKRAVVLKKQLTELSQSEVKSLQSKLRSKEAEYQDLSVSAEDEQRKLEKLIKSSVMSRLAPIKQLHELIPKACQENRKLTEVLMRRGFLKMQEENARRALREAEERDRALLDELKIAKDAFERAKAETTALRDAAKRSSPRTPEMVEKWATVTDDLVELESQIENHNVRIAAISPDRSVVEKYNAREAEIAKLKAEIESFDQNLQSKQEEIEAIRKEWMPAIVGIVEQINANFSQFFKEIGCVGEVKFGIDGDNFARFGIEIWVSYRAKEAAKKLDSQVQSGGERSVATMLYLIALQQLSDCPFRLVDEINQGMDPHNERMIFRQVTTQASKDNTPQYFLITPKLLPNLHFTPAITMLCVFNGPFMVDQRDWIVGA